MMWLPDGEKNEDIFIRFDRMYESDRHRERERERERERKTDTQTPHYDIDRASIASRGRKCTNAQKNSKNIQRKQRP